jgi:hypothetical protein
MEGTGRPSGVDVLIMERLLNIFHDLFEVVIRLIAESTDMRGYIPNRTFETWPQRSEDILT